MNTSANNGGETNPTNLAELREAVNTLRSEPDVAMLCATLTEVLREIGFPEEALAKRYVLEAMQLRRELSGETDRGVALFTAAYLDDRLAVMLRTFFVSDQAVADPLFKGTGALSSFSGRIDLSYLTGLLSSSLRRELHLIRKVRNEFAHSAKVVRFTDEAIAARCNELSRATLANEPRLKFIQSAMSLAGIIDAETLNLAEGSRTKCVPAEELPPATPEKEGVVDTAIVEVVRRVAAAQHAAAEKGSNSP